MRETVRKTGIVGGIIMGTSTLRENELEVTKYGKTVASGSLLFLSGFPCELITRNSSGRNL